MSPGEMDRLATSLTETRYPYQVAEVARATKVDGHVCP